MSLTITIALMIGAWVLVAGAMLWGVLRIARRHHQPPASQATATRANAQAVDS